MRSGSIAASRSLSVKWKKNAEGEASAKKHQNRDGECHIGDSYADLWYVRAHRDYCISPRSRHTYGHRDLGHGHGVARVLAQVTATVGLGFYAFFVGPLVAHDGIGAFVAGMLLAVSIEGYRRTR